MRREQNRTEQSRDSGLHPESVTGALQEKQRKRERERGRDGERERERKGRASKKKEECQGVRYLDLSCSVGVVGRL